MSIDDFTPRHSISSDAQAKRELEEGIIYTKALEDKVKFEKEGYIFEVSSYYAMVHKDGKMILEHKADVSGFMRQAVKEEMYSKHNLMAVNAVRERIKLGKMLLTA